MNITVKVGGGLRKKLEGRHHQGLLTLDMPEGCLVSELIAGLGLGPDEVRVLMLNGRPIAQDQPLKEGDRLGLFPRELAFNVMTAVSFFNPLAREARKKE